jgi:hypothetical protein
VLLDGGGYSGTQQGVVLGRVRSWMKSDGMKKLDSGDSVG